MTYLALYRAWRPKKFSEVVGQEQIVTALKNAIKENRLGHAYLLAGPRGTGKTSIAKIIAKAVNCSDLIEGEPCNQCANCIDINNGSFMDVIEIDAASNRGIDEIRDLREKVRILPAQGEYKIYIIDEVHMLTTEAFNALLKTIEEPPEKVIFILATTEVHKIPATIRSRCQIYNFRRLTEKEIVDRLNIVADASEIKLEDDAVMLIAKRANGGMRDALSIMDQIFAYKGGTINKQDVLDILGLVDDLYLAKLMDAVFARDLSVIVQMLDEILNQGKEAQQLARETAMYLRDLMIYTGTGNDKIFYLVSEDSRSFIEKHKKSSKQTQIMEALRLIMSVADRLRFSEGQRFILEIGFLQMADILSPPAVEEEPAAVRKEPEINIRKPAAPAKKEKDKNKDDSREVLWNRILNGVKEKKIPTHALLSQGKLLGSKEDIIYIGYKKGYKFHKERMEEKGNREILESVLEELFQKKVEIQFIFLDDAQYNDIIVKKAIEYFGEDIVQIKD